MIIFDQLFELVDPKLKIAARESIVMVSNHKEVVKPKHWQKFMELDIGSLILGHARSQVLVEQHSVELSMEDVIGLFYVARVVNCHGKEVPIRIRNCLFKPFEVGSLVIHTIMVTILLPTPMGIECS